MNNESRYSQPIGWKNKKQSILWGKKVQWQLCIMFIKIFNERLYANTIWVDESLWKTNEWFLTTIIYRFLWHKMNNQKNKKVSTKIKKVTKVMVIIIIYDNKRSYAIHVWYWQWIWGVAGKNSIGMYGNLIYNIIFQKKGDNKTKENKTHKNIIMHLKNQAQQKFNWKKVGMLFLIFGLHKFIYFYIKQEPIGRFLGLNLKICLVAYNAIIWSVQGFFLPSLPIN